MNRFIPLRKQTKKQQKKHYSTQRSDRGTISPVTRVVGKAKPTTGPRQSRTEIYGWRKRSDMDEKGYRKTGRCYRRCMRIHKNRRLRKIIEYGGYNPYRGYVDWDFIDGHLMPVGKYIKYPRNSKAPQYLKRQTWHRVRRYESLPPKGNYYRKIFDFWWELF